MLSCQKTHNTWYWIFFSGTTCMCHMFYYCECLRSLLGHMLYLSQQSLSQLKLVPSLWLGLSKSNVDIIYKSNVIAVMLVSYWKWKYIIGAALVVILHQMADDRHVSTVMQLCKKAFTCHGTHYVMSFCGYCKYKFVPKACRITLSDLLQAPLPT